MKLHSRLRVSAVALAIAGLAAGCNKSSNSSSSGGNPLTAPVDYLGATVKAQQSATKTIDLVSVNQAIQLFNTSEGRNPKDLDELVTSHYIGRLPTPPYGMKLNYDAAQGKVTMAKADGAAPQ
jgi:hypothetical protein